jgi:DMSO/TMAO reductase YedYZ heme-binding membrane subunit
MAFAVVFAVFDIAEVAHQIKESRAALALLAATIALVHVATTVVAEQRTTTAPW